MIKTQKVALSIVITTAIAFITSIAAMIIIYQRAGMPTALKGLAFMGLSGVGVLTEFIFKKEKGKFTRDERDKMIHKQVGLVGFAMSYLFIGTVCMASYGISNDIC